MAKKTRIVGGMTQQFYHTIPDDKDFIITSPKKESIFEFLSQIGFDKFPEFIKDILVKIEKHTIIDITDGPGDEKQDILTTTPEGHRCLIQCKHSINISSHYSGDELDRIVSACLRKNCKHAIFVTNTDLTPQAKKYVTDKEYLRGWPEASDPLVVEYWNDNKLWDKIKNNSDILNKWFGNLGQTHGLRNFKFELSVQSMPIDESSNSSNCFDSILHQLVALKKIHESSDGKYFGKLKDETEFFIEKWFLIPSKLNINYSVRNKAGEFINTPQYGLSIEVIIPQNTKYSPNEIIPLIVRFLLQDTLQSVAENSWWHLVASQAKSFIFLHDLGETRQITLNAAETFVKISNEITSEIDYISLHPTYFNFKSNDEDEDSIFIDKTAGIQVIQLFDQPINPYHVYEQQIVHLAQLEKYKTYSFKAVKGIDSHLMMRVRRIINHEWVAIQYGDDTLFWGIPPDIDDKSISYTESKLKVLGLKMLDVREEVRDELLGNIRTDMPPPTYQITSELNNLIFPIDLSSRIFWLSKDLSNDAVIDVDKAMKLLEFKWYYENINGFDNAGGNSEIKSHTSELPNMLADIMTIRGKKMLDIGILNKPYSINLRFRDADVCSSNSLALRNIEEFKNVYNAIERLIISNEQIDFEKFNL